MKLKEVTLTKTLRQTIKIRENFRTIEVGLTETYELDENEKPNFDVMWDGISHQLRIQMGLGDDPSWMATDEEKAKPWDKTSRVPQKGS